MTTGAVVIVGTGQAGFQAAASLRQEGYDGAIRMFGDEPGLPYQRPPLSKTFVKDGDGDRLLFRNADFFEKNSVKLEGNIRVAGIHRGGNSIQLEDGNEVRYDHLILATGSRNLIPLIAGTGLGNVVTLRTLVDAGHIYRISQRASDVVMIGGGFIGLEMACVLRSLGCGVTVVEATPRIMARAVSEQLSAYFLDLHRAAGITIYCGVTVTEIRGDDKGRAESVILSDGTKIICDLVLICAGVAPNSEIASDAGLTTENGICVDNTLLTDDESISAIGDCASFVHKRSGARVRLESVQNAVDQGKCVASRIAGKPKVYDRVPWFWSDQGGAKLQIAGLTGDADKRVVRQDKKAGKLSVFAFKDNKFLGVETVNNTSDHMTTRKLLAFEGSVSFSDLKENDFNLRDILSEKSRSVG